jgi:peptidylprolyl isomerase domain and WD repeat-containing protein 1
LWKKQETGIEFVKHYRAHIMPIVGGSASADGELFASIAEDESAKVFDVVNFGAVLFCVSMLFLTLVAHYSDMINMIKLGFAPKACCWVHRRGQAQGVLAVYVLSSSCLLLSRLAHDTRQLGTTFWYYSAIRWSWGW